MRPRAIGGDEVQPAGHDICLLSSGVGWALSQRCLAVTCMCCRRDGVGSDATGRSYWQSEGRGKWVDAFLTIVWALIGSSEQTRWKIVLAACKDTSKRNISPKRVKSRSKQKNRT